MLLTFMGSVSLLRAQLPPPEVPAPPPAQASVQQAARVVERTPPRLSFLQGQVSFWRPGAEDWTPAQLNTPLAPGDALYSSTAANSELQIGTRAFVRIGENTQLGFENQDPDFLQFKITSGHAAFDVRTLPAGHTVELDTPNGAFAIETAGYYRIDTTPDTIAFVTRRGGRATVTSASGEMLAIASSEEVVIQGNEKPSVETYVAPELDAWDRWNYARTDHLIDPLSERYVPPDVYGADDLDHYGTWRVLPEYGPLWIPQGVPPGWAPYSAGAWIWDPYYQWTWVDYAPWGWAPYHYGRWVFVNGFWGWAPGPLVATPVYAPALVAFFGGPHFGASVGISGPAVGWVALGWGEPLVPWWGPVGFIGTPWWGGWGGPRIVEHITVYQNVRVTNALIVAREDRFGRGRVDFVRVHDIDPHQLEMVQGRVPVRPLAVSVSPATGHALRPPDAARARPVVSTRATHDSTAALRGAGLEVPAERGPAPRIVSPSSAPGPALTAPRPPFGEHGMTERQPPPLPPQYGGHGASGTVGGHRGNLPGQPANRLYSSRRGQGTRGSAHRTSQ